MNTSVIGIVENSILVPHRAFPIDGPASITEAAAAGDVSALRFLIAEGGYMDELSTEAAALANSIECLMLLHENSCPWDERATTAASMHSDMKCLIYALTCDNDNPCPISPNALLNAIVHGSVLMMAVIWKWQSSHPTQADVDQAIMHALKHGRHRALRYLLDRTRHISDEIIAYAKQIGDAACLDVLNACLKRPWGCAK